jgi:hypothetical protein
MKFIEHRVADRRILRLIRKWLKAGVSEDGQWPETKLGTPQGAVASPLIANVYLHYLFDLWADGRDTAAGGPECFRGRDSRCPQPRRQAKQDARKNCKSECEGEQAPVWLEVEKQRGHGPKSGLERPPRFRWQRSGVAPAQFSALGTYKLTRCVLRMLLFSRKLR